MASNTEKKDRLSIEEDKQAIEQTLKGDRRAFEKIVVKYQKPLYAVLYRLVSEHEDVDDLLQECFVRAFTNLRGFDTRRPLYPWLRRISVNLAITFLRRSVRQSPQENLDIFPSSEQDSSHQVEQSEFHTALQSAISELPDEQRVILLLRVNEDMSYRDLSQELGIEIGTVMSRLARAREKLRGMMGPFLTERLASKS